MAKTVDISIIIVSYNTSSLTQQCLSSLISSLARHPINAQIIVVDNHSEDGSVEMLQRIKKDLNGTENVSMDIIEGNENLGFSKANNRGLKVAKGEFILYLNSDTLVDSLNLHTLLDTMREHPEIGVLSVRVNLANGSIDPACHRGFPTLWRSLTYFSKLEMLTQHIPVLNKIFGGYHLKHLGLGSMHEIDSPTGAFFLTRKDLVESLQGFDEAFFMYGEDLDLSMRIKQRGLKVMYDPSQSITHLKGQSGTKHEDKGARIKTRIYFYDAMRIFYKKHYMQKYPSFVTKIVFGYLGDRIAKLKELEAKQI